MMPVKVCSTCVRSGHLALSILPPLIRAPPPSSEEHGDLACCRRCAAKGPWKIGRLATDTWGHWADAGGSPVVIDPKNRFRFL